MIKSTGIFLIIIVTIILPASSQNNREPAVFQEFRYENIGQGIYSYTYNTQDNIYVHQDGKYQNDGNYVVQGSYSYEDPLTNKLYRVVYYADKNGYHPHFSILSVDPIGITTYKVAPRLVATMMG